MAMAPCAPRDHLRGRCPPRPPQHMCMHCDRTSVALRKRGGSSSARHHSTCACTVHTIGIAPMNRHWNQAASCSTKLRGAADHPSAARGHRTAAGRPVGRPSINHEKVGRLAPTTSTQAPLRGLTLVLVHISAHFGVTVEWRRCAAIGGTSPNAPRRGTRVSAISPPPSQYSWRLCAKRTRPSSGTCRSSRATATGGRPIRAPASECTGWWW